MKESFVEKNLRGTSLSMISQVNKIVSEYQADGYVLTVRQLYYQMVARDLIENSLKSYKNFASIVNDGRLVGLIDWSMIEDRGRELHQLSHWRSLSEIIKSAAQQFAIDKWADQPNYVEVMVEKQALEGVLLPVCQSLDISFTANKGYSSSSALYEAGKRLARQLSIGKDVYILYLGDHDPSGIDMTRDVLERVGMFARSAVTVNRLALNMAQVDELKPPENPAKTTDSRFNAYMLEFGSSSWELDAIEPRRLADILTKEVVSLRNSELWDEAIAEEERLRNKLIELSNSNFD